MKYIRLAVLGAFFSANAFALDFDPSVAKAGIEAAKDVAIAAINKNKTETEVTSSDLINTVDMQESAALGNIGIEVTGDKVSIKDSTIENDTKLRRAVLIGNGGVKLGN